MTRELKLALIVGFALVLGVTVLISDHLSKARKSELDSSVVERPQHTPAATEPKIAPGLIVPDAPAAPREVALNHEPMTAGTLPGSTPAGGSSMGLDPKPVAGAGTDRALEDAVRGMGGEIKGSEIHMPPLVGGVTPGGTGPAKHDPNVLGSDNPAGSAYGVPVPKPTPGEGVRTPQGTPLTPAGGTDPKAPGVKPVAPASPTTRDYTVQSGDSVYKLAKQYMGSGEQWKKIVAANPGLVGPEGQLKVGSKIKIPVTAAAKPATDPVAKLSTSPLPKTDVTKADPAAKPGAGRTYTVKKGDTLGEIAKRELKSSKRAGEILKLNPSLEDADSLHVGMVLKLPAA